LEKKLPSFFQTALIPIKNTIISLDILKVS
jgi:hypothetical protein